MFGGGQPRQRDASTALPEGWAVVGGPRRPGVLRYAGAPRQHAKRSFGRREKGARGGERRRRRGRRELWAACQRTRARVLRSSLTLLLCAVHERDQRVTCAHPLDLPARGEVQTLNNVCVLCLPQNHVFVLFLPCAEARPELPSYIVAPSWESLPHAPRRHIPRRNKRGS